MLCRPEGGAWPGNTVFLRRQSDFMVRSESGVNTAVYLGSFRVATFSGRGLVSDTSAEVRDAGEAPLAVPRTIALVGLMGAGKSCIGRLLASSLGLPFMDADKEIEAAAGCSVEDIFAAHGEAAFRDGERRVIARLLDEPPMVLATGGGAFMDPETRAAIKANATSVWLKADLDTLVARTARRDTRPLLRQGDPRAILKGLMEKRHPVYAEADLTVESASGPPDETAGRVLAALKRARMSGRPAGGGAEARGSEP